MYGVGLELFATSGNSGHWEVVTSKVLAEVRDCKLQCKIAAVLTLFCAIAAAGLFAAFDAERVERTADNLVSHTRQVADTAATDQHDAVFLQRMAFTGDVGSDFLAVREPHTGDFPQSRVRLFGRHRADLQTDAPLLWAAVEDRRFAKLPLLLAVLFDKLVDCWHRVSFQ